MKDLRDPVALGEHLLGAVALFGRTVRFYADLNPRVADYDHNPGPIEKYGDPRLIPSTLPN